MYLEASALRRSRAAVLASSALALFLTVSLDGIGHAQGGRGGDAGQGPRAGGHGGAAGRPGQAGTRGGGGAPGGAGAMAFQDGGAGAAGADNGSIGSPAGATGFGGGGGGGGFNGTRTIGPGSGGRGGAGGNANADPSVNAPPPGTASGGGGGGGGAGGSRTLSVRDGGTLRSTDDFGGGDGGAGGAGGLANGGAAGPSTPRAGSGGSGGSGGSALILKGSGVTFGAAGAISGGAGGTGGAGGLANGGSGSDSASSGGAGGDGQTGGAGLVVSGPGTTVAATNTIAGGAGGAGGNGGNGNGGSGSPSGSTGGAGGTGAAGGIGAIFRAARSAFTSTAAVSGGQGGAGGSGGVAQGGSGSGSGSTGGAGGSGGTGGVGAAFLGDHARFFAGDSVSGGFGGAGGDGGIGFGGSGDASGSTGGAGGAGAAGASGVSFTGANARLTTSAIISGGAGGNGGGGGNGIGGAGSPSSSFGGAGGRGGDGGRGATFLGSSATVMSRGVVQGGAGGNGGAGGDGLGGSGTPGNGTGGNGARGGAGGTGMVFAAPDAVLVNRGSVTGGTGGAGGVGGSGVPGTDRVIPDGVGTAGTNGAGGRGGVGLIANGILIDNAGGSISGGAANGGSGVQDYAIAFVGGRNFVGTGGTINGGIDVEGSASFAPALPGSAVGTPLAIAGPLVFARTSTYSIRIAGRATDSVVLTNSQTTRISILANLPSRPAPPPPGTAKLHGAQVFVQGVAGRRAPIDGMRYTIVTAANGVAGRFNPVVASNLAFLTPTLAYDPTHVYLDAAYDYAITAGLTRNQRNVAAALQAAAQQSPSAAPRLFNALNAVQTSEAPAVLDTLSGEGITAAQNIAQRSAALFTSSIFDQTTFYGSAANSITLTAPIRELADMPANASQPALPATPNRTWRAWATGFGGVDNIHGNGAVGSTYQQNTIYGGTLAVDYQLMPNYLVGVALGGTNGDFLVPGRATSGSTTGGHVAIYDRATFGAFYGASSTSFSYFTNRSTRVVSGFGGLGTETERGSFDSHEFRSRLEFGRHVAGFGGVLTPFVAMELAELRSNGFTEQAIQGPGLFRLNVSGQSAASAPAFVGLRLQRVTALGNGLVLSPSLQVAYVHEFAPYRSQFATIADLPGSTFLVDGARPARNAAQIKAGAELALGARSAIFANFDGELSGVNQLYAGKGGFRWAW